MCPRTTLCIAIQWQRMWVCHCDPARAQFSDALSHHLYDMGVQIDTGVQKYTRQIIGHVQNKRPNPLGFGHDERSWWTTQVAKTTSNPTATRLRACFGLCSLSTYVYLNFVGRPPQAKQHQSKVVYRLEPVEQITIRPRTSKKKPLDLL